MYAVLLNAMERAEELTFVIFSCSRLLKDMVEKLYEQQSFVTEVQVSTFHCHIALFTSEHCITILL